MDIMQHRYTRVVSTVALLPLLCSLAGCTLKKQTAPSSLTGPSEVLLPILVSASPDTLARDGTSASTITVTTRDGQGNPVQKNVVLSTTAGSLSATSVNTDTSGHATVQFTAPPVNPALSSATITATAQGTDVIANPDFSNRVVISLVGAAGPAAVTITASSTTPGQYDLVTFSGTSTVSGSSCTSACTYVWNFGDGSNATGQSVTHRFQSRGTFTVTLTVSTSSGTSASTTTSVTVGAPQSITAAITFSPTDPSVNQTVYFDGTGSKTPDGAKITNYSWDLGNGSTATGSNVTTTYSTAHTYTVRLTVTDELGRTGTTTTTVTVK